MRAYASCKDASGAGPPAVLNAAESITSIGLEPENPHPMDTLTAKPPAAAKPWDGLPPRERRWAVAAIFTALAMGSLDTVIANIALPAMAADLHVSPAEIVWVINVYQIVIVATVL